MNNYFMLYVLFGSDHYRRAEFVREIVRQRQAQYPNIIIRSFDCADEGGLLATYVFTSATNLFEQGKKICVCAHGATVLGDPLLARVVEAAQRTDHIIFLVEDFDGAPPDEYRKLLAAIDHKEKEFKLLSAAQLRSYAQSYAQQHGNEITPAAAALLVDIFGTDTWGLCTQLDMLGALGRVIDERIVRAHHAGGFLDAFAYAQGILRAPTRAARLLQWELAILGHNEPMLLFNIMAKSASDKKQVILLSQYDRYIKSGLMSPDQALVSFCCAA